MSETVCHFHFVISNDQGSTNVDVVKNDVTLGRAVECDVQLHSESISRKHFIVSCRNRKSWIEDCGSVNGTFINGERIPAKTPVELKERDRITLGNTSFVIFVQADFPSVLLGLTHDVAPEDNIELEATILFKKASNDRQEAEAVLAAAKQKVLQMIRDAEIEAEKKSQEVYARADALQRKAEEFLKHQTQQAYAEADTIYAKAKEHGQTFLQDSRDQAQKIREEALRIADETRQRSEKEAQEAVAHARKRAQDLHDQRIQAAEEEIRTKEFALNDRTETLRLEIAGIEAQMKILTTQRERDLAEVKSQENRLTDLEKFLRAREEEKQNLEKDLKALHESSTRLQAEIEAAQKSTADSQRAIEDTRKHETFLLERAQNLKAEIQKTETTLQELSAQRDRHQVEVEKLEKKNHDLAVLLAKNEAELSKIQQSLSNAQLQLEKLNQRLAEGHTSLAALNEEKNQREKENQFQVSQLKEAFEKQKLESEKAEETRFQRLQMDTAKKIERLEHEMMDQIHRRRSLLEKEIVLAVETTLKGVPEDHPWPKTAAVLQEKVAQLLSSEASASGQGTVGKTHRKQLTAKSSPPAFWKSALSMAVGAFLFFAVQNILKDYVTGSSPISRQVANLAQQQKEDLAKRKFDPPQYPEMQKNYVESVVSTSRFSEIYLDDTYQKRWFSAATAYLLKTWRMEEDKSLQALSASAALVKNLKERREAIHPDFVKDGLEKMNAQERETLERLRTILGSQVRLESYLKFEHEFFDQNRAPASH